MSESDFVAVCKVGTIPENSGQAFAVHGRMVAVFYVDGKYQAIDDFCPHMGASLAGGVVDHGMVACPWHAWRFKICDGTWCDNPRIKIDAFEVKVEGDDVMVRVPSLFLRHAHDRRVWRVREPHQKPCWRREKWSLPPRGKQSADIFLSRSERATLY
jgi:nitrite reductase (NADH) small subunit